MHYRSGRSQNAHFIKNEVSQTDIWQEVFSVKLCGAANGYHYWSINPVSMLKNGRNLGSRRGASCAVLENGAKDKQDSSAYRDNNFSKKKTCAHHCIGRLDNLSALLCIFSFLIPYFIPKWSMKSSVLKVGFKFRRLHFIKGYKKYISCLPFTSSWFYKTENFSCRRLPP